MMMILAESAQIDAQSWNPFAPLGVTSWEPFVANLIAFIVLVLILKFFAFGPVQKMLEERRRRIQEGEDMRLKSEEELANVQVQKKDILFAASSEGQKSIDAAKDAAARLLLEKEQEADRQAQQILAQSREGLELEKRQTQEEIKSQFSRLIALATAQVTGKILTEEDHRRINQEAIDSLNQ